MFDGSLASFVLTFYFILCFRVCVCLYTRFYIHILFAKSAICPCFYYMPAIATQLLPLLLTVGLVFSASASPLPFVSLPDPHLLCATVDCRRFRQVFLSFPQHFHSMIIEAAFPDAAAARNFSAVVSCLFAGRGTWGEGSLLRCDHVATVAIPILLLEMAKI